MATSKLLLSIIVASFLIEALLADRTRRKIYENIQADHFCFRRLNATHQIGCASGRSGNVGVVHLVETDEDITYIIETGPHYPYTAVLPMQFFNMNNMKILKSSGRVSGVMVLKEEEKPSSFSPDQSCPNQNFGLYSESDIYSECKKVKWNPPNPVLGMMYEDWNIPIFLITNRTSIDQIINKCYNKFNRPQNGTPRLWPLCSAKLKSVMNAAKDTSTCMRRSKLITNLNPMNLCDPLSGRNIITTLFAKNDTEPVANRSVIIVSARLDAFSMYDKLSPGAHTTVTGLVTLLAIAHTMATLRDKIEQSRNTDKRILFTIFNGEAFDYIGSSRMVYDMKKGEFPSKRNTEIPAISLHHISHFIELSQLAPFENKVWFHVDPVSTNSSAVNGTVNILIKDIQNEAAAISTNFLMEQTSSDIPLPPASFQSFLKHDKNISGIVIADHSTNFTNKYYNSFYDNAESLGIINDTKNLSEPLAVLVAAVSNTLFKMLTGENNPNKTTNEILIEELLNCYLMNISCNLFREMNDLVKPSRLREDESFPLYIGVEVPNQRNLLTAYTQRLLSYLSGEHLESRDLKNCTGKDKSIYNYYWMAGSNYSGICVKSAVRRTPALSPAFLTEDWKSTEYSTWSESVWEGLSVVIFLQPSILKEATTLLAGCIISVVSLIVVYFINKRASVLFGARNLTGC